MDLHPKGEQTAGKILALLQTPVLPVRPRLPIINARTAPGGFDEIFDDMGHFRSPRSWAGPLRP